MSQSDPIVAVAFTSFVGALISGLVSYFFSQRRYTFEKIYDKKLLYLEEIYGQIISLEADLNQYTHTIGSMSQDEFLERRRAAFTPIRTKFFELQSYFRKKEIALDKSTVEALNSFLQATNELVANLDVSNMSLQQRDHETSYKFWKTSYNILETKLMTAKDEIKKDFTNVIQQ